MQYNDELTRKSLFLCINDKSNKFGSVMNRNEFLKVLGAGSLSLLASGDKLFAETSHGDKIKPDKLNEGDTVGVIAPGTAVSSPDDILRAEEILNYFNLNFKFARNVITGSGYKTRTVNQRLDDLHEMFADRGVKAVFCLRGGYGSGRLLDKIDYNLIKNNPKMFVGYSDISAIHLAIGKLAGLVSFHAPVLLSPFNIFTSSNFRNLVFGSAEYPLILRNPQSGASPRNPFRTRVIVSGEAEGEILCSNLSLLVSLLGTEYLPDFSGKLLLLEDVAEPPYRIDRMLNQLRLAGIFGKVKGIIFGRCDDCVAGTSQATWDFTLGEVLDSYFAELKIPVFYGLLFGHTENQLTIPMSCLARMNADEGSLTLLESPFR